MMTRLSQAAEAMQGQLRGDDGEFRGISTDTRTLGAGELFFALSGPNFDGGRFVDAAFHKGAAGAVVADAGDNNGARIEVDDTRLALGRFAAAWRQSMPATVIGITGSNGKTTVRAMTASCLAQRASTLATSGNLNNEIGLPLMLARLREDHVNAVFEMGANHAGEIAYLAGLAQPDIVALLNAGAAHLEGFGSIEGVARAKGEILSVSPRPRIAILNADDNYFDYWSTLVEDIGRLSFGLGANADVRATDIRLASSGSRFLLQLPAVTLPIALPFPGEHNVVNACAAAAIATAAGATPEDIIAGLQSAEPVGGRLQPRAGVDGTTIYDDSYNANPLSVRAAAEFLAGLPGAGVLVLGDMGELGGDAERLHFETGAAARYAGVNRLFATGELSRRTVAGFGDGGDWFESIDTLLAALQHELEPGTSVLVKGSRFMRMERVVAALLAPADDVPKPRRGEG